VSAVRRAWLMISRLPLEDRWTTPAGVVTPTRAHSQYHRKAANAYQASGPLRGCARRAARHRLLSPAPATPASETASAYRTAVLRPDLLAALPCFCGCVPYAPADQGLAVAE